MKLVKAQTKWHLVSFHTFFSCSSPNDVDVEYYSHLVTLNRRQEKIWACLPHIISAYIGQTGPIFSRSLLRVTKRLWYSSWTFFQTSLCYDFIQRQSLLSQPCSVETQMFWKIWKKIRSC